MASKNEDKWLENYEALKAHVAETGHFPDKHSIGNKSLSEKANQGRNDAGGAEETI